MNEKLSSPMNSNSELMAYEKYLDSIEQNVEKSTPICISEAKNMSYIPTNNSNLPETLKNTAYMPAYLSKHIGKLVRVEFLLGNSLCERTGILMNVGAGFIVLRFKNNATLVCESDSIRFVTIIHNNDFLEILGTSY